MRRLAPRHECSSCNVKFRVDLENNVEARFTPNRAVRATSAAKWCMGGPMNTPHVLAQVVLGGGEARPLPLDLPEGRYGIRPAGVMEPIPLEIGPGDGEAEVRIGANDVEPIRVARGGRLVLKSVLGQPLKVGIERAVRNDAHATAAEITAIQEFRDLFATEALAPGVEMSIGTLAIMFSDLKGSTALYERIGDAPAYALVRQHFEFMTERIRAHHGAIVKTIGDAVMAVFRKADAAVRCALTIQRDAVGTELTIKLGIHVGPCIAVSKTDYLDYFGSTVNIAARTQDQSLGGDVVVTSLVMRAPGVRAAIADMGAHESSFQATLRGLESMFELYRLVLGKPGDTRLMLDRVEPGLPRESERNSGSVR